VRGVRKSHIPTLILRIARHYVRKSLVKSKIFKDIKAKDIKGRFARLDI